MRNLYAVGMKGWVEILESKKRPAPRATKAEVRTEYEENDYSAPPVRNIETGRYAYPKITRHRTLKLQCTNVPGKLVATIPSRAFTRWFHISIKRGGILQLSTEMIQTLKDKEVL